jgi:methionine synthase I (cobalamin-dependent)
MNGGELRALVADEPLLADGGIGSSLIERGAAGIDGCIEVLNLERPDIVADVHAAFAQAGARLIEANSFGANRFALA